MATWEQATDAYGIVNPQGNRGAAQIFQDDAVDKNLARIDRGLATKLAAEKKKKADEDAMKAALKIDADGWIAADGAILSQMTSDWIKKGSELIKNKKDPRYDSDMQIERERIKQLAQVGKEEQKFFDTAMTEFMKNANQYDPEEAQAFLLQAEKYKTARPSERNPALLTQPAKIKEEKPYDYFTDFMSWTGGLRQGQKKFKYTDDDGAVVEGYGVDPKDIDKAIEGMAGTKWYQTMSAQMKENNPDLTEKEIDTNIRDYARRYMPSYQGKTPAKEATKLNFNYGSGKFGNNIFEASKKKVTPSWLVNTFGNIEFQDEFISKVNKSGDNFTAIDFAYKGSVPESQYKPITVMMPIEKGEQPESQTIKLLPKTVVDTGGGTYYVVGESITRVPKYGAPFKNPKTGKQEQPITGYDEKKTDAMFQLTPESKQEFEKQWMDGTTLEEFLSGQTSTEETNTPKTPTANKFDKYKRK